MLKILFTPIRIGKMELKNRIVMPAMHFLPSWEGALLPHHTDYFVERARGGAALIIIGGCTIDDLSGAANMISVKDDQIHSGACGLGPGGPGERGQDCRPALPSREICRIPC